MSSSLITIRQFNAEQTAVDSFTQRRERKARYLHDRWEKAKMLFAKLKHPGRPLMNPHGSWVTDKAENQKGLLLCSKCSPKFDPRVYSYYRTKEFLVHGKCDACKTYAPTTSATIFIHESFLGNMHGQCWTPQ